MATASEDGIYHKPISESKNCQFQNQITIFIDTDIKTRKLISNISSRIICELAKPKNCQDLSEFTLSFQRSCLPDICQDVLSKWPAHFIQTVKMKTIKMVNTATNCQNVLSETNLWVVIEYDNSISHSVNYLSDRKTNLSWLNNRLIKMEGHYQKRNDSVVFTEQSNVNCLVIKL